MRILPQFNFQWPKFGRSKASQTKEPPRPPAQGAPSTNKLPPASSPPSPKLQKTGIKIAGLWARIFSFKPRIQGTVKRLVQDRQKDILSQIQGSGLTPDQLKNATKAFIQEKMKSNQSTTALINAIKSDFLPNRNEFNKMQDIIGEDFIVRTIEDELNKAPPNEKALIENAKVQIQNSVSKGTTHFRMNALLRKAPVRGNQESIIQKAIESISDLIAKQEAQFAFEYERERITGEPSSFQVTLPNDFSKNPKIENVTSKKEMPYHQRLRMTVDKLERTDPLHPLTQAGTRAVKRAEKLLANPKIPLKTLSKEDELALEMLPPNGKLAIIREMDKQGKPIPENLLEYLLPENINQFMGNVTEARTKIKELLKTHTLSDKEVQEIQADILGQTTEFLNPMQETNLPKSVKKIIVTGLLSTGFASSSINESDPADVKTLVKSFLDLTSAKTIEQAKELLNEKFTANFNELQAVLGECFLVEIFHENEISTYRDQIDSFLKNNLITEAVRRFEFNDLNSLVESLKLSYPKIYEGVVEDLLQEGMKRSKNPDYDRFITFKKWEIEKKLSNVEDNNNKALLLEGAQKVITDEKLDDAFKKDTIRSGRIFMFGKLYSFAEPDTITQAIKEELPSASDECIKMITRGICQGPIGSIISSEQENMNKQEAPISLSENNLITYELKNDNSKITITTYVAPVVRSLYNPGGNETFGFLPISRSFELDTKEELPQVVSSTVTKHSLCSTLTEAKEALQIPTSDNQDKHLEFRSKIKALASNKNTAGQALNLIKEYREYNEANPLTENEKPQNWGSTKDWIDDVEKPLIE